MSDIQSATHDADDAPVEAAPPEAPLQEETPPQEETGISSEEEAQRDLDDKVKAMMGELSAEYGAENVTELLVEAAYNEKVAQLLVDGEEELKACVQAVGTKVSFYLHTEPGPAQDLYVLRSLKPGEWNSAWLRILSGDPGEFEAHGDAILQRVMVYPSFEGTDWDWTGEGLNSPSDMVKERLVSVVFDRAIVAPTPEDLVFEPRHLDMAQQAAKKRVAKPSF